MKPTPGAQHLHHHVPSAKKNGQVERFNRTLGAMLRCYDEDSPGLWCLYAPAMCYAYRISVRSTTGTTLFDLVLSRPPPEFTRVAPRRLHTNRKLWAAPVTVPRLANSPMESAPMLYEALLIRDEFAKILSVKITFNLWFNIYAPDGNTCTRLCSVLRVQPGIRPRFEFKIRLLPYFQTVLRYWRDAGWVRGTTSQL